MKTLYIDMDNVVVDFPSAFKKINFSILNSYKNREDEIPNIFGMMNPMENAQEAISFLAKHFDVYFLSTAPWENETAWGDKLNWIKNYFPTIGYKRLILSHNKHLNIGDYLIDDRLANGADKFTGEHIHYGTKGLKNWKETIAYIAEKENLNTDHLFTAPEETIAVSKDLKALFTKEAKQLQSKLFPEETDNHYDSTADASDRKRGINPMSEDYIKEVETRRANFGVSPLGKNGLPTDTSSLDYCKQQLLKQLLK